MKFFLVQISSFILLLFVVNIAIHSLLVHFIAGQTRMQEFEYEKSRCLETSRNVFLGDSHVQNSVISSIMPTTTNFSMAGENYLKTYYKSLWLIKNAPNIEQVFLSFNIHSFSEFGKEQGNTTWYWKEYVPYLDIWGSDYPKALKWFATSHFMQYSDPALIIQFAKHLLKYNPTINYLTCGYQASSDTMTSKELADHAFKRSQEFYVDKEYPQSEAQIYFEKSISLFKHNDIQVSLIHYPVSKDYYDLIPLSVIDEYARYGLYITKEYNIAIYDAHEIFFEYPEYFQNSDHLNQTGAQVFSKYIHENIPLSKLESDQ